LVFWILRELHWVKFTFETGFELPSSWTALPCYGLYLDFNGQSIFEKIAGSTVIDEYYNSPKKVSPIPALKYSTDPLKPPTIALFWPYGWIGQQSSSGFINLAPSILHYNWF
jgi:hypothetical protein